MRKRSGKPYLKREDDLIEQMAGKVSAEEIGKLIGRSRHAVWKRMQYLGLDGRVRGERHWNAKLPDLQHNMIRDLAECGYSATEIFKTMVGAKRLTYETIKEIALNRQRSVA